VQVEADLFDLFATLGASDEQMEYPVLYASAKQGWAVTELDKIPKQDPADATSSPALSAAGHEGMRPLFDAVLEHCPAPALARKEDDPFSMITIQIESGAFFYFYCSAVQICWRRDAAGRESGIGNRSRTRPVRRRPVFRRFSSRPPSCLSFTSVLALGHFADTVPQIPTSAPSTSAACTRASSVRATRSSASTRKATAWARAG
jgi:hypothetical protein